jgi:MoaA/NifB/PqqE/SkfB family radical SAM enzyme
MIKPNVDFIDEITSPHRLTWTKYKDFERHVLLNITHKCNYNCPYCFYLQHRPHASEHYRLQDILSVIETVMDTFPNERIAWFIIGGEPTQYPLNDLLQILDKIKSYNRTIIEFQSNGSAPLSYYHEIIDYLNCSDFSYHYVSCKDFEHFLRVVGIFYGADKLENLDLMFPSVTTEKFKSHVRQLLPFGDHIEATYCYYGNYRCDEKGLALYRKIKDKIHPAEHKVRFRNCSEEVIRNKSELYGIRVCCFGMKCSAMNKYMAINGNGDYAPCGTSIIRNNRNIIRNLLTNPITFRVQTKIPHRCVEFECIGEWYLEKQPIGEGNVCFHPD